MAVNTLVPAPTLGTPPVRRSFLPLHGKNQASERLTSCAPAPAASAIALCAVAWLAALSAVTASWQSATLTWRKGAGSESPLATGRQRWRAAARAHRMRSGLTFCAGSVGRTSTVALAAAIATALCGCRRLCASVVASPLLSSAAGLRLNIRKFWECLGQIGRAKWWGSVRESVTKMTSGSRHNLKKPWPAFRDRASKFKAFVLCEHGYKRGRGAGHLETGAAGHQSLLGQLPGAAAASARWQSVLEVWLGGRPLPRPPARPPVRARPCGAPQAQENWAQGPSNKQLLLQISAIHKGLLALSDAFLENIGEWACLGAALHAAGASHTLFPGDRRHTWCFFTALSIVHRLTFVMPSCRGGAAAGGGVGGRAGGGAEGAAGQGGGGG